MLMRKREELGTAVLRRFAIECSRRVALLCSEPSCIRWLEFAEQRVAEPFQRDERDSQREDLAKEFDALYPGDDPHSAAATAMGAMGVAAFAESDLSAAKLASGMAARALAIWAEVGHFDEAHGKEREAQWQMLQQLIEKYGKR